MANCHPLELPEVISDIQKADFIYVLDSEKNLLTRSLMNITACDQEEMVKGLTEHDYHSGPEPDYDNNRDGMVWKFKISYKGTDIYIKVKWPLSDVYGHSMTKCLSCHIDYL